MSRIAFLIPDSPDRMGVPATPHVGIASLAAFVRENGHEPRVIDLRVEPLKLPELRLRLQEISPDMVAVTSTSLYYRQVYKAIRVVTEWGWRVVYGGPHVSLLRESIYNECQPWAAVYGEGELPLLHLLEGRDLADIAGVIYRNREGEVVTNPPPPPVSDLDSLPFAAYELSSLDRYAERKIPLMTSRGCPCHCTFCAAGLTMEKRFRPRSPQHVVAEISLWYDRGYRLFGINDDNFTADMERAGKICDLIIEKGLDITWELRTGIRIDRIDEALLTKMHSAGCTFVAFGIEAIDDAVLLATAKGIDFGQIDRAVGAAERVGIPFSGFFMIGLPGDTFDKFERLYRFAASRRFDEVRFYNVEPYPRTAVYGWVEKHGRWLASSEEYLNSSSLLDNRPLFETEEFPLADRLRATALGEALVVRKLLVKTVGPVLGEGLAFLAWTNWSRKLLFKAGFRMAPLIRKLHARRASAMRLPCRQGGGAPDVR